MSSLAPPLAAGNPVADQSGPGVALRKALVDSRQRWRDLVSMAADLVFETDAAGRFVLIAPDPALGWPVAELLDQPSRKLLVQSASGLDLNPFNPAADARRFKAWVRRADGSAACLMFAVAPLLDAEGRHLGARGLGTDVTEREELDAKVAAAMRRGDLVDHILWRMRQEVLAPKMMKSVLESVANALGAEGAVVIELIDDQTPPLLRHATGGVVKPILQTAAELGHHAGLDATMRNAPDGRHVMLCASETRFGERAALAVWRPADARDWDEEDQVLLSSVTGVIRVVLEHESIQREMIRQARTDPLTTLLNRGAFLQEAGRRIDRLEREDQSGALIFLDLDNFKALNDRFGHETGDLALRATAALLREAVRPADLVARLGGDEFALWLDGMDQFTAAERAEALRLDGTRALNAAIDVDHAPLGMSIGIAVRDPGSGEDLETLIRRADAAMYEVKRAGRGHWRVAQPTIG